MKGITVRTGRLDDDLLGGWDPVTRTIWLDARLTPIERRCTLAHELVHAERADGACASDWHDRKRERQVSVEAAYRLVSLTALADALRWCIDEHELAEELHVDFDTIRVRLDGLSFDEHEMLDEMLWDCPEQSERGYGLNN
jgi:Zn-dependent peptidase ImmA (M78 family)